MKGAQPTETAAYILNKIGVLGKYLEARPDKKKQFRYLDKRTAAMSVPTAIDQPAPASAPAPAPAPAEEAPEAAPAPEE